MLITISTGNYRYSYVIRVMLCVRIVIYIYIYKLRTWCPQSRYHMKIQVGEFCSKCLYCTILLTVNSIQDESAYIKYQNQLYRKTFSSISKILIESRLQIRPCNICFLQQEVYISWNERKDERGKGGQRWDKIFL